VLVDHEYLAEVAEEMGVTIRTGEPARQVVFEGRRAVGVRTDRGVLPADRVVINADFARAMQRLVPDRLRRRWTDARIAAKRHSGSTFMMYLGLEGLDDRLAHHTFYMAEDYRRNLREIEVEHRLSDDPSLYVQNACVTDPSLAPAGMSTLHVLAPVPHLHPNVDWRREAGRFRAVVLRQLRDRLGIEDLERRIRFEKVVTPRDWDHHYEVYRGATFGLVHQLRQLLLFRPRNRFEDLDGVYLVGGGTHPGSGLPVIFESARISARLLLESLEIDHDWIDAPAAARPSASRGGPDPSDRGSEAAMAAERTRRVGVIGGGLGGLAAACTLAARGHAVVLFEKNAWLGGKAAVLEAEGFRFDMGPTILTAPAVLARIFAEAGREMADYLDLVPLDPQWRCFFADRTRLDLCADPDAMRDRLEDFAPGSSAGYRRFLDVSRGLHEISRDFFFWRSVGSIGDIARRSGTFRPRGAGEGPGPEARPVRGPDGAEAAWPMPASLR
jgi:phytoene dehydrogenase-like protein